MVAAISKPHDPLFNPLLFLHSLEEIALIGQALSDAAYDHVEQLAALKQTTERNRRERATRTSSS